MTFSVIIITHNEEQMLPQCLESVAWADEIVVIDKKSTDKTLEIARKYHAKIGHYEGEAFDEWRNLGIYHASGDWLLYVDPDERITPFLKQEIQTVIRSEANAAYKMPRKNYWWGEEFKVCGAWPDYVTRLFQKSKLEKWHGLIHESPTIRGSVGMLDNPILHLTHRDLVGGLKKSANWTKMESELFYKANHPPVTWWRLAKVTLSMFLKKYFREQGYRAGTAGFIEASVQAWNRFMVYEQLWELQQQPSLESRYKQLETQIISNPETKAGHS